MSKYALILCFENWYDIAMYSLVFHNLILEYENVVYNT